MPECDLVVGGVVDGIARGWIMEQDGLFRTDIAGEARLTREGLEALSGAGTRLTFMCVPWGSGRRVGIDRDLDGVLDGDERP